MTSTTNQSLGSKAQQISLPLNIPSAIPNNTDQQPFSQNRSSNNSESSGGGAAGASRNQANPRNSQGSKARHRNHRKPSIQREDILAETLAMTSNGRKGKTSITHLMDWSIPHPQIPHGHSRHSHGNRKNSSWGLGSGYHSVDKARLYVNANYRFIVDPSGDYRPQTIDPDTTLPWNSILQILVSSISQDASCPICLSPPVAPRMARCGHIFCLPCLIRYMASEEETPKPGQTGYYHPNANQNKQKWKKCPICHDSVYMNEVRPVKFYQGQETPLPKEGSDTILRLMVREPGSTLALPKDVAATVFSGAAFGRKRGQTEEVALPWHYAAEITDYARIMKGTQSYMREEFEREIIQLEDQARADEVLYGDETESVKRAIGKIKSAIERVKELPEREEEKHDKILGRELYEKYLLEEARERAEKDERPPPIPQTEFEVPDMYLVTSSSFQNGVAEGKNQEPEAPLPEPEVARSPVAQAPLRSPTRHRHPRHIDAHDPNQPYYFYQLLPHCYLAPLDIRILRTAFGSYNAFPSTVLPRVENLSMGHVIDDELRKRMKYLGHLPYGCEVSFLECDWTDIVPADVLQRFSTELDRRRRNKRDKETREERDRVRAEREEDEKRWSGARRTRGRGEDDDVSLALEMSRAEFSTAQSISQLFDTTEDEGDPQVPNGPRLGFANLPQSSPPSSRTVWGTPAVAGSEAVSKLPEETKPVSSGWLEGWEKDALVTTQTTLGTGVNTGKGKKKFKKVTLMTNTGRRGA
ncbi:hypothetical protein ABW19_dt0208932 [Dactylella cylindrospora]|nr:hypothetical protein ABW19_dt0208932 [Dactylella cylindrospora]